MTRTGFTAFALLLLQANGAAAQDSDLPKFHFDGFGTLGVVHSSEERADFVGDLFDPEGAGHSSEVSAEVDSRLGLQLTAELTPKLTAVGQAIVEQRYDGTYKPELEWANIRYDLTPNLTLRAGRVLLPTFMDSEHRNVGYALPWVRPPLEVYRMVPVTSNTAVGASYRFRVGETINSLRLNLGRRDIDTPGGTDVEAKEGVTLSYRLERGPASFFAGYSTGKLTVESVQPLFDGFRQLGPPGQVIADRFGADDKRFDLLTIGARYDPGDWFIRGELARRNTKLFLADSHGWYVTGGYRFGSVTPYLTLADRAVDSATSVAGVDTTGLAPALAAQARQLNAGLNGLLGSAAAQKRLGIGARWDIASGFALKLQLDHMDLDEGSPGFLVNEQPGFQRGGTVTLFSATLDFVF